jgi:hypothetical protein
MGTLHTGGLAGWALALARDTRIMRFQASYVSTSVAGDYYQAIVAAAEDTDDPDSPYLLLQRQFEMPDGGECYIETHDKEYIGHYLLRRVEFTSKTLSIEFDRPTDNLISVTFDIAVSDFKKAARVVKIISQIKSGR